MFQLPQELISLSDLKYFSLFFHMLTIPGNCRVCTFLLAPTLLQGGTAKQQCGMSNLLQFSLPEPPRAAPSMFKKCKMPASPFRADSKCFFILTGIFGYFFSFPPLLQTTHVLFSFFSPYIFLLPSILIIKQY